VDVPLDVCLREPLPEKAIAREKESDRSDQHEEEQLTAVARNIPATGAFSASTPYRCVQTVRSSPFRR